MGLARGAAAHRSEHKAISAERTADMLKMRRGGATYDEIGAAHDVTKSTVARVIRAGMNEARDLALGEAELYRVESIDRLTALLAACWDRAIAGSDKHIAEARRIIDSLSTYTGARMPIVVELGESDVDRTLRELDKILNERARTAQG